MQPKHGNPWTPADLATLHAHYPNADTAQLAQQLGRSPRAVHQKAAAYGIKKSAQYFKTTASGRLQTGDGRSLGQQFTKGSKPWNTGKKGWQAGGRSAETRFKKGEMHGAAQRKYVPVGTLRLSSKDAILERKVTDAHPVPARRWVAVHRLVWEAAHGPIPAGHVVRFKPGQRTNVLEQITLDRLECISQAENARRNSVWTNFPPEIGRLVQLKGAINRQANRIAREQNAHHAHPEPQP